MKNLLLTFLFLGLVAVLKAQEAPPDYQDELSGTWHVKAMVCDKDDKERKPPKTVFPLTVTSLEGGDLEVKITFSKQNQCHEKKFVLHKTDEPGKYTAHKGKKTVYIQETSVKDHYILYCECQKHGQLHRKGKLVGKNPEENPAAMEEFRNFAQRKGFARENIVVPEHREQCVSESD